MATTSLSKGFLSTDIYQGVTLIELLLAIAILSILIAISIPEYKRYSEQSERLVVEQDMTSIEHSLDRYYIINRGYPDTLAEAGINKIDTWGNPYQYQKVEYKANGDIKHGSLRKDKNLHPLNTDYDLYSMGENGETTKQIITPKGRDDIIRANNGGFIGLASNYDRI